MSVTTANEQGPPAGGDPRTSFRVDTQARGFGRALREYVSKVRGGEPGGLPAVLGLLAIGILFAATTPLFLTAANIGNLMSQASYIGLMALGLVFVLILGEIDLSAGATGGVAAGFAAQALRSGDLHSKVGTEVFWALMIGMVASAGIALWKRLPVVTGLIVLGVLIELTGLSESNVWFSFAFAITIGMAIGVINGVLVTSLGIPSFIVTLGLFLTWTGVTLDAVQSQSIGTSLYDPWFSMTHRNMSPTWSWIFFIVLMGSYAAVSLTRQMKRAQKGVSYDRLQLVLARLAFMAILGGALVWWLNQNRNPNPGAPIQGMPWAISVPIMFVAIFTVVLTRTSWGRHLYAIGGNIEAARRTGIPVERVRITAFVLCSSMAAIGGLFLADYSGGAQPSLGQGNTLLYAVAAAVIGGTSLFGGRGKPRDAVIGAFVIAMIPNGIQLHHNLPISFVAELTGVVLLVAASVDAASRRRSRAG